MQLLQELQWQEPSGLQEECQLSTSTRTGPSTGVPAQEVELVSTDPAWDKFVHDTVATATEQAQTFMAGKLRNHDDFWKIITSDSVIISQIMGSKIKLENEVIQTEVPDPYTFPPEKQAKIDIEI